MEQRVSLGMERPFVVWNLSEPLRYKEIVGLQQEFICSGADGGEPLRRYLSIENASFFRSPIRTFVVVFVAAGKVRLGQVPAYLLVISAGIWVKPSSSSVKSVDYAEAGAVPALPDRSPMVNEEQIADLGRNSIR